MFNFLASLFQTLGLVRFEKSLETLNVKPTWKNSTNFYKIRNVYKIKILSQIIYRENKFQRSKQGFTRNIILEVIFRKNVQIDSFMEKVPK